MNKTLVAKELLMIAKDLMAVPSIDWAPVRKDVDVGRRNTEVHDSLTSFAPRLSVIMQKEGLKELQRQDFQVTNLKREWSEYLALVDPMVNANKYHYYGVYSFVDATGVTRYVALNCSGRIGMVERVYDLTEKYLRGPVTSASRAQDAAEMHMKDKLRKGYQPVSMIRG